MKHKILVVLLIAPILISCSSISTQAPTLPVLATSTLLSTEPIMTKPTFTETLSPTETSVISNPVSTERLCASEDFSSSLAITDLNNLDTLIGYRPNRDWLPAEGWETTVGISNRESHYLLQGYKNNSNQHLFILEKPICRYGENGKYGLTQIVDYIWLPSLAEDEIIIWSPATESCCFLQSTIIDRLDFRLEWFAITECNISLPNAIMTAKYELAGLPPKITVGDGYDLPVKIIKGWLPNMGIEKFEEFATEDISCVVSFMGG
jgi:hypothetical protein